MERRRRSRYQPSQAVKFRLLGDPSPLNGAVLDLSVSGARIISWTKLAKDQKIILFSTHFVAKGRVLWIRRCRRFLIPSYEFGVHFDRFVPRGKAVFFHSSV